MSTLEKQNKLKEILSQAGNAVIALSGGTDSVFLTFTASKIKEFRLFALIVNSPYMFLGEISEAIDFCLKNGIRYKELKMEIPEAVLNNPPERCYLCKQEIMSLIKAEASGMGMTWVFDGTNADDIGDYRPGMRALKELGIRSPLLEAGLTKSEIRELSKAAGLATWNKPSNACLLTRFPHGAVINAVTLRKAEAAELVLDKLGIKGSRVRVHNDIARIECTAEHFLLLSNEELRKELVKNLKDLGYKYITLDLEGYRTGSMNLKVE